MSTEFKREERYLVFKLSDAEEHFTPGEKQHLERLVEVQRTGREEAGKPPLECVVIESDWPEYEPTWRAIETRMTGAQPKQAAWPTLSDGHLRAICFAYEKGFAAGLNERNTTNVFRASGSQAAAFDVGLECGRAAQSKAQPAPSVPDHKTIRNLLNESGLCAYDREGDLAFMVAATKFAALVAAPKPEAKP